MFKKLLILSLTALITLCACGTLEVSMDHTPTPEPPAAAPAVTPAGLPLSMDSSSEAIQQKMLHSALNWKSIWLDGVVTANLANPPEIAHQQVWIDQLQARFRFLGGPAGGEATNYKVSDGISILKMDIASGQTQMSMMPEGTAGQFVPELVPDTAFPNPIWGQIGEQLVSMAFSADYAQNQGVFKPFAVELVAERQTLAVEWTYIKNTQPSWLLWLDVQTGVILKMQDFGKGGGDTVENEYLVTQVLYDIPDLSAQLFSVHPVQAPVFSDVAGTPLTSATPGPVVQAGAHPLGEIYFFVIKPADDDNVTLAHFPGSCIVIKQACPAVEQISLPGKTYGDSHALAWSTDGKKVAFVANAENGQTRLFFSEMPVPAWKQIAEFPSLDLPSWSADGNWISFRAQDENDNYDYYVVRTDGTGLKNISASDKLPAEDRPYMVDAWIGNNLLLRSGKLGREAPTYLLRVDDMHMKPLFSTFTTKAAYLPSPDGSLLAFDEYNDENSLNTLRIIAPDGSSLRDLASFKTQISSLAWSPDMSSLAIAKYSDSTGLLSAVYTIGLDGRGLKQVYSGGNVTSMVFSPDGKFLLVEDIDQQHIFVVDLTNLEIRLLPASGLNLMDTWRLLAWVP